MDVKERIRSTTILAVRHRGAVVLAGDGQVTLNDQIIKGSAKKIRLLGEGKVLAGFAGSAADGMTLLERFQEKLQEHAQNLTRSASELAKDWRTDKILRRLEALMIVADRDRMFLVSGNGDVIEPEDGVVAIGSGGAYALSAARALVRHTDLHAREIAQAAMTIAAEICVYTNQLLVFEELS